MLTIPPPLFLDGEALVIDKPAGLPVDRPRNRARSIEDEAADLRFGFQRAPLAVHRLDRDTSGCLLLARNPKALARFAAAFEQGQVEKAYLAVVDGVPAAESGTIDLALGKASTREEGWRIVVDPEGKRAVSHWRRLAVARGRALLQFEPETGRTHQLRVHALAGLGLPIVGDPVYGRSDVTGMMLHASRLKLARPGKADIFAEALMPARFRALGFGDALA